MHGNRKGPWSQQEIDAFLDETRVPLRLSCNGAHGSPVLLSLWFTPGEGRLWCATQRSSRVVELLGRDERCAFEVAGDAAPYCGVRGQGAASLHDDRGKPVLQRLIDRYLGGRDSEFARWLLARADTETAIAIEPHRLVTWDFRERMGQAA